MNKRVKKTSEFQALICFIQSRNFTYSKEIQGMIVKHQSAPISWNSGWIYF